MKTINVRLNKDYLYVPTNEIVTVVERIKNGVTKKRNMKSGIIFTGYVGRRKRFRLSNGLIVKADKLKEL